MLQRSQMFHITEHFATVVIPFDSKNAEFYHGLEA